jgi:hypothetical protein
LPNGIDDVGNTLAMVFLAFWEDIKNSAVVVSTKITPNALAMRLLIAELPVIKKTIKLPGSLPSENRISGGLP